MVRIPQLDKAGLRKFGITTGILIAVLFGLFIPWLFELDFISYKFCFEKIINDSNSCIFSKAY